ncbi:MAG: OsmC family protein, partial [Chitinophagaceae bacterium]|nr:OsmC family protein [Chitinophagaceae bacterium]
TAIWNGSGKEGKGHLATQSGVLKDVPYTYKDRFEEGPGTNPEELIAAAHAGCFSMKLSFVLGEAGFTPDEIETRCEITLANGAITKSHLIVKAKVPGIDEQKFKECAENAKANCPVSKLLNTDISMEASLS